MIDALLFAGVLGVVTYVVDRRAFRRGYEAGKAAPMPERLKALRSVQTNADAALAHQRPRVRRIKYKGTQQED